MLLCSRGRGGVRHDRSRCLGSTDVSSRNEYCSCAQAIRDSVTRTVKQAFGKFHTTLLRRKKDALQIRCCSDGRHFECLVCTCLYSDPALLVQTFATLPESMQRSKSCVSPHLRRSDRLIVCRLRFLVSQGGESVCTLLLFHQKGV